MIWPNRPAGKRQRQTSHHRGRRHPRPRRPHRGRRQLSRQNSAGSTSSSRTPEYAVPRPGIGSPRRVPRHHRHQRHRNVEHRDGACSPHHRRRPRRLDHPHRIGRRHQHAVVHGPLRREQTRRRRDGSRVRRRTRPLQHPRQQPPPRSCRHTRWATARCATRSDPPPTTYPYLRGMHRPLLPEGIAQPEDIADAVAWLASDQSRFVTATQVSVDIGGFVLMSSPTSSSAQIAAGPLPHQPLRRAGRMVWSRPPYEKERHAHQRISGERDELRAARPRSTARWP